MSAVIEKQTAVATAPSLISRFAQRYNVEPAKLLSTLKATAFYNADGDVTNEQMMALLIVADQYGLNPFTREIYAFPDKKKGGIVPIVSIDGWARLVNAQEAFDGVEFVYGAASDKHKSAPEWIECVMHRKDRQHPTRIRERLIECYRDTGPWNSHPERMLRHKAFMQCGRIAFALVGIYDEDEAQRIITGETIDGHAEASEIASINKTINRGKATIEGEAKRVEPDPPAANSQPNTEAAATPTGSQAEPAASAHAADAPAASVPDPNAPGASLQNSRDPGLFTAGAQTGPEITVIDAIAAFAGIGSIDKLDEYTDQLPAPVKQDPRVMKKFKERRDEIKDATGKKK